MVPGSNPGGGTHYWSSPAPARGSPPGGCSQDLRVEPRPCDLVWGNTFIVSLLHYSGASVKEVAEWCTIGAVEETRITLRLPQDLWEWVKQLAEKERRSLNAQLVYLIEQAAKRQA